ncbi:MAG: type I-U CRISPR-associated RAMP protein Csb1/Cas7u [Sandaracinaceae bacterium]
MANLTIERLEALVGGEGVALRVRQRLQPAGGVGDKVFPPTYSTGERTLKYVIEKRRVDGQDVDCVLLDSVASQANRMEEALLDAWERKALDFPVLSVDFSAEPALADIGSITSLQAPHRIADAILRDATDASGKVLFRDTPEGKAFTDASTRNATAVLALCPTALVFGVWDSTGPKGGLGAKFQRALSSEIVGVCARDGAKVGSRIDPLAIQANVDVFHRASDPNDWTIDPAEAQKDAKGKPIPFTRGKGEGKGKPSAINHSNVAPTVDRWAGGVTLDYAEQTSVLSLPALRRLRFRTDLAGQPLPDREAAELAARTALAALAVAAIVRQREVGYDLRSRCLLVPEGPLRLEIVRPDGQVEEASVSVAEADALVRAANERLARVGLGWKREPLALKAAPKLLALVKRSRELAAADAGADA